MKTSISEDQDHLCSNTLPDKNPGGDPGGDPSLIMCENIQSNKIGVETLPDKNPGGFYQGDPGGDPLPPSPLKRDDFQEKHIYWSPRLNNQVMVWKLFKSLPEAEVFQAGNPIDKIRIKLSELYPLPEFKVGEEVAVSDEHKKFKDKVFTISAVHPGGIWIEGKTRAGTDSYGPFKPNQLRKLSG